MNEVLMYLGIPVVAGAIGWITNKFCIIMTLRPIEFVGIKPPFLGWQGIIPARAPDIATSLTDIFMGRVLKLDEIFKRLDLDELAAALEPHLPKMIRNIVDTLMMEQAPDLWVSMPLKVRERVYKEIDKRAPQAVRNMVTDIGDNIEEIFDLEALLMDALTKDRKLLVTVFEEISHKEFKFIINSGGYFGFLFGTVQMFVWMGTQAA